MDSTDHSEGAICVEVIQKTVFKLPSGVAGSAVDQETFAVFVLPVPFKALL